MSTDVRVALLVLGAVLVAVALLSGLLAMAGRKFPGLSGSPQRLVAGLIGAALIGWMLMVAAPRGPRALASGAAAALPPAAGASSAASAANTQPDLVLLAGAALDGCKAPTPPADPPDGAVATRAQMTASHVLTAGFDGATNAYIACIDGAAADFNRQYGPLLSPSALREVRDMQTRSHNAAVDVDDAVADRFNRQLRIYKARGGAS